MKSSVAKRSIMIEGHRTSVSLEDQFWTTLKEIAARRDMTLSELVSQIDTDRHHADRYHANLSSALRLFVLGEFMQKVSLGSHRVKAGVAA